MPENKIEGKAVGQEPGLRSGYKIFTYDRILLRLLSFVIFQLHT